MSGKGSKRRDDFKKFSEAKYWQKKKKNKTTKEEKNDRPK